MRLVRLEDPLDLYPSNIVECCSFTSDSLYLAIGYRSSPYISVYSRSEDSFTKLNDPNVLPTGTVNHCSFSPDGVYLAVVYGSAPYFSIYKRSEDSFIEIVDPLDVSPPGNILSCSFSPDGMYLALGHYNTPYVSVYKRNGDSFTKLDDPQEIPVGQLVYDLSFSLDGNYITLIHSYPPYMAVYKRSEDSFTKLNDPLALLPGATIRCSTADGLYHAFIMQSAEPYAVVYKRDGDDLIKLNDVDSTLEGVGTDCSFSPGGTHLVVGQSQYERYIVLYERDGDSFTEVEIPPTLGRTSRACEFSPDGKYLAVGHLGAPYITIYKDRPPQIVTGSITFHGHSAATFGVPIKRATGSITFHGHSSMFLSAIKTAVGSITFHGTSTMELIGLVLRELEGIYQIPSSEIFSRNQPILSEDLANYIEVWINPMVPATAAEEIYRSKEAESIPAGETKVFSVEFDEEPVIEAAATLENAGANLSIITADTKYYGSTAEIAIYNSGTTAETCVIVVTGKPLEVQGRRKIVVKDEESILDHGLVKYEFDSPLVQDEASARDIGQKILRLFSVARANIEITWRGDPAQELADICQIPEFEKLGVTKKENFYITRQQFVVADGGMDVSMAGRKVPPKEE